MVTYKNGLLPDIKSSEPIFNSNKFKKVSNNKNDNNTMKKFISNRWISCRYFEMKFYLLKGAYLIEAMILEVNCSIQKNWHSKISMLRCLAFTLINIAKCVFQN